MGLLWGDIWRRRPFGDVVYVTFGDGALLVMWCTSHSAPFFLVKSGRANPGPVHMCGRLICTSHRLANGCFYFADALHGTAVCALPMPSFTVSTVEKKTKFAQPAATARGRNPGRSQGGSAGSHSRAYPAAFENSCELRVTLLCLPLRDGPSPASLSLLFFFSQAFNNTYNDSAVCGGVVGPPTQSPSSPSSASSGLSSGSSS